MPAKSQPNPPIDRLAEMTRSQYWIDWISIDYQSQTIEVPQLQVTST